MLSRQYEMDIQLGLAVLVALIMLGALCSPYNKDDRDN